MKKFILFISFLLLAALGAQAQCVVGNYSYSYQACSQIQFVDSSVAQANYNLVSWKWNFGDGTTATGQTVIHTFTPGITVNVKLVVTADSSGVICRDSIVKSIVIHSLPTVYVAGDYNPSCIVVPAKFFGSSGMEPYIKSWQWDFGDGTFDTMQNPTHLYPDTGTYQVVLHVIDSNGCANENITPFFQKVNPLPSMNFNWNIDPAAVTDNLQFSATVDTSVGKVTSWHWNFGDGDTANIQNPTHQYKTVGQYSVTLSVVVGGFCPNSITKVVHVEPLPAPDFSYSVACLRDITYFSDSTTTPVGTIQTWKWYFGDGDSLIISSPGNPNVKHIYVTQAVYPVTLLTINSQGYLRSITKNISVVPKPTAFFTFNDTCYTNPTSFFDKSSLNTGSSITYRHWNFGDGDSARSQNPAHTYSLPGTYSVTLRIANGDGCRDTVVRNVVMDSLPAVDFAMSKDTICLGENITFSGQSTNIASWHWGFGNGTTSSYQNPIYRYPAPGLDTITLTVKDLKGCSSYVYHTVYVKPSPVANFVFTILCKGDTTCFSDSSSISKGFIKSWNWDFGDNTVSTVQNPDHYYQPVGNYNATLTVTSNESCSSAITKLIIFDSLPSPNFSVSAACKNDTTYFTDGTTTPVGSIQTWRWYFGDGDSLIVQSPNSSTAKHVYLAQTTYDVKLLTVNSLGFERSIIKQITVHLKPYADFTFNDTCSVKPISFTDLSSKNGGSDLSAWSWNFGDPLSGVNNQSSLQNPTHIMSLVDTFDVRLIVTNIDGCTDTAIRSLIVDSLPIVDFTMQKDSLCFGENALFHGTGKDIISWHWNFGNGDSSTFQNPVYNYPSPGLYTVTLQAKSIKGCPIMVSHNIYVIALPQSDFTVGSSCIGDSTSLTDMTSCPVGYVTRWQWNFDDTTSMANQSTLENPAHHFTTISAYNVQLITTNNYGCSDTNYHYVNVYAKPKSGFTYHQSCRPATEVVFSDTSLRGSSKSPISSYLWKLYQDDSSNLQNPTYRFPYFDSCYQISLTVTDTNGCYNTDTAQVCLRDSLRIDFTMPRVCFGQPTAFRASYLPYTDSIASYTWDFNDGSKEVITYYDTISHVFPHPGTYSIRLSALDTNGCSITVTHQAIIDSLPVPNFAFATPECDQPTYFTDSTLGGGNFISTWQWSFGDVSSDADNHSNLQNPSHIYSSNDSLYQVKLIVTNFNGCIDSVTKPMERKSCLKVFYTVNTGTGCADNPIYFKDRSILNSAKGSITDWNWDFGDGYVNTYHTYTDSILHVYTRPGSYLVSLMVRAEVNGIPFNNKFDSTIVIFRPPISNFVVSKACSGQMVYFTDSTKTFDAILDQWQWTFNDSYSSVNVSDFQNPEHLYDSTGSFMAHLVVTDHNNCRDTVAYPVEVHPSPDAAFNVNYNYNGVTAQVLMDNTSTGADSYLWDFGDGNTSTQENPLYSYTSRGVFNIILVASSQFMCTDTAISVYDLTAGLYIPNSFAPGMDVQGVNVFQPKGIHLKEYHIQVYSSWGSLVWESNKLDADGVPQEGWDGTFKGKPMPAGSYIWRVTAKFIDNSIWQGANNGDGNTKSYGTLTLIR